MDAAEPPLDFLYEVRDGDNTLTGERATPSVCLSSAARALTVTIPEFWQQFPSSLAAHNDAVVAGLFPSNSGGHELQGGEQKTLTTWISIRSDDSLTTLDWVHASPQLLPSRDWVRACGVIPWLPDKLPQSGCEGRFAAYLTHAMSGDFSVEGRRDRAGEYGWRNFGDVHADHEQTHFTGAGTINSHYNNQFDLIFGGIQNLIMSGDPKWVDLFEPLARHVIDIDIYHTDEDRACFNGGLFWHTDHYVDARTATHRTYSKHNANGAAYGGGPSNEHNYTTGLLHHYYLTGNAESRDAVISLADWVINIDDGSQTVFGLLDDGPTGLASATADPMIEDGPKPMPE